MLSTVLTIVAVPLEGALRSYLKQDPSNQDIEPLLRALRENIPLSRRTGEAENNDLETWCSTAGGSLITMVRHSMQGLIQWCLHSSMNGMPPSYTHRQMIVATKMVGAKCLLAAILEELKQQTEAGTGGVAYDIATAMICAPDVTNEASLLQSPPMALLDESGQVPAQLQRRIPLRAALKHAAENWNKTQKSDASMAEVVVRLYRRVEAQMAPPPEPQPGMLETNMALDVVGDANALDDAIAAAAAAAGDGVGGDALTLDTSGVDHLGMGGGDAAGDLGGLTSAGNSAGGLDLTEQDIFGNLGDPGDFNLSWGPDTDFA
jgi:mediator of RNA polymerase II transcription subunit 5